MKDTVHNTKCYSDGLLQSERGSNQRSYLRHRQAKIDAASRSQHLYLCMSHKYVIIADYHHQQNVSHTVHLLL